MSSVQPITPTADETVAAIVEKAKVSGDRFIIKVLRRKGFSGLLEHIATLGDATVQHAAAPETWLPQLCGGGEYGLSAYHHEAPTQRVGNILHLSLRGQSLEVSGKAVRARTWEGPPTLIFPQVGEEFVTPSSLLGGLPPPPTGGTPAATPGTQANSDVLSYVRSLEERLRLDALSREKEMAEREARLRREIDAREEQLRREQLEAKLRTEFDARQRDLETRLAAHGSKEDGNVKLLAVLAPVIAEFLKQQHEMRVMSSRQSQEAAQQQLVMLKELTSKPQGMTPEMTILVETLRSQASGGGVGGVYADMMTRMVDAMGAVSKTSVSMIEAIADLQLGSAPQEHPVLAAVKEGIKAMSALSSGAEKGARSVVQQARHPHPTSLPPPPVPRAPQGQPQAFAGYQPPAVQDIDSVTKLKMLIQDKHEPVAEVAVFFFDAIQTPEMQQELKAVDQDIQKLVAKHLGAWVLVPENSEYLNRLGEALQAEGVRRGAIQQPAEGDDGVADGADDGEEVDDDGEEEIDD